jgi:serine/threonine-protein kinase HipA
MNDITHCPGTLAEGYSTYSRKCLTKMFKGKKVDHILAYDSPLANADVDELFDANRKRISISGVQEKFSVLLEKNRLRLATDGEQGEYILKPIPAIGKRLDQMPANEHLTMQIAKQVFKIETAENALVFFKNGEAAYLTKRFDLVADGSKLAQEDFASLAKRTPQTHGDNYKYAGNYLELFNLLRNSVTAYLPEASKLLRLIIFNYLFSNGDAHFKNFSLIETALGDFKLSPAYDLLNSRIHIEDQTFALSDGLLPRHLAQGKVIDQFKILAKEADIKSVIFDKILKDMLSGNEQVEKLIFSSFLDQKTQRNYWQSYQGRLKQLKK